MNHVDRQLVARVAQNNRRAVHRARADEADRNWRKARGIPAHIPQSATQRYGFFGYAGVPTGWAYGIGSGQACYPCCGPCPTAAQWGGWTPDMMGGRTSSTACP